MIATLLTALIWLLTPGEAQAQSLDTFTLSSDHFQGRDTLQLVQSRLGQRGDWAAGLGMSWAKDPLVIYNPSTGEEEALISSQLASRVSAAWNLSSRVRLGVELPLYPRLSLMGETLSAPGDLRLEGSWSFWSLRGLSLALAPRLELPSGDDASFASSGFTGGAVLAGGIDMGAWFTVINLGLIGRQDADLAQEFDPEQVDAESLSIGSYLPVGLGLSRKVFTRTRLGVELDASVDLQQEQSESVVRYNQNPAELHGWIQTQMDSGVIASLGGGTGLVAGVGVPEYRVFASLGYRRLGVDRSADLDGDGLVDVLDACPDEPEDFDGFEDEDGCPDLDDDQDGIPDTRDQCPDEPEDFDGFEDEDGCPDPDNDQDQILDVDDVCPHNAEDYDAFQDEDGCPDPDNDEDGIIDKLDACPDLAGLEVYDGCPRVVVTISEIVINERIYFDFDKASIQARSYQLLDEIAQALRDHPELLSVEVQGHTDDVGSPAYNLKLSQRRAEAVVSYLVGKGGVEEDRLFVQGYGESQSAVEGTGDAQRAENRRVQFLIRERAAGAEAP